MHSEYKNDLMGSVAKKLNQSHYDNIVKYTLFKLIQGQKNLLPEYRSSSVRVIQNIDANSESSPSPADIPEGRQPRGIKKAIMKLIFILFSLLAFITCFAQVDTLVVKKKRGFLFLSSSNYIYDYDGRQNEIKLLGFHDFFFLQIRTLMSWIV